MITASPFGSNATEGRDHAQIHHAARHPGGARRLRQSGNNSGANNPAANSAAAEKPRPAYCFFKDAETKDWAAKTDKDGNVVVTGKAYREDPRYKALLSPAMVTGTSAQVSPTITANDTGLAAPDNWWTLSETIPNSQAVGTVMVKCGDETVATLKVPRNK